MYVLCKSAFHGSSSDSSDDDDNKFYARPTVLRHQDSSSAPSVSDCEELSGAGRAFASPKIFRESATVKGESTDRNTKAKKRSRIQMEYVESSAERVNTPKKKSAVQVTEVDSIKTEQAAPRVAGNGSAHEDSEDYGAQSRKGKSQMNETTSGKSSGDRRVTRIWSAKDEITVANALLACCNEGRFGTSAFHERVKDRLEFNFDKCQLYEKTRRMKSKYQSICSKMAQEGNAFRLMTRHEVNLFQIWKKIWGFRNGKDLDADDECSKENPRDESGPFQKGAGNDGDDGGSDGAGNGGDDDGSNRDANHVKGDQLKGNFGGRSGDTCDLLQRQSMAVMDKLKVEVQTMLEDVQLKTASLVDSSVRRALANASAGATNVQTPWGLEAETGMVTGLSSILSTRMKELRYGVYSVKKLPSLGADDVQALQQRWRKQLMRELKLFARRLELLHDECQICLKDLETRVENGKS